MGIKIQIHIIRDKGENKSTPVVATYAITCLMGIGKINLNGPNLDRPTESSTESPNASSITEDATTS